VQVLQTCWEHCLLGRCSHVDCVSFWQEQHVGRWWHDTGGKTEQLRKKPVSVPLCPPQISHELTWGWTWASAVRGRLPTAWVLVRPTYCKEIGYISVGSAGRPADILDGCRTTRLDARGLDQASRCEMCGGPSGTGTGFSASTSVSPSETVWTTQALTGR
jgi:hypothetical protein